MVETMGSITESGDKTQEVEKRALLKESEYIEISKKLEELGAELTKQVNIKDIYFCPVNVVSFAEIEMDSIGSYSLRLREQKTDIYIPRADNAKDVRFNGITVAVCPVLEMFYAYGNWYGISKREKDLKKIELIRKFFRDNAKIRAAPFDMKAAKLGEIKGQLIVRIPQRIRRQFELKKEDLVEISTNPKEKQIILKVLKNE